MNKKIKLLCLLTAFSLAFGIMPRAGSVKKAAVAAETAQAETTDIGSILGVTHAAGNYAFDPSVSMVEEGARIISDMGAKVIKLWLSGSVNSNYPYNTDWNAYSPANMVGVLATPYFRNILSMDFETYVFEAMEFDNTPGTPSVNYADGMTDAEKEKTEQLFYDLTAYLMRTYNGSHKKFVLQNWEGDNYFGSNAEYGRYVVGGKEYHYLLSAAPQTLEQYEEQEALFQTKRRGIIDWVNARQAGVDRAVSEYGSISDVDVKHAFEINYVALNETERNNYGPMMLEYVVPYTDCDIYSYSCWQCVTTSTSANMAERILKYKEVIGSTYTDIEDGQEHDRREIDGERIMIGEFGTPESEGTESGRPTTTGRDGDTSRIQRLVTQVQIESALSAGVRYMLYWELFCNEAYGNASNSGMADDNEEVRGFYLIRPDGTYTDTYYYIKSLLSPASTLSVNTDAWTEGKVYTSDKDMMGVEVHASIDGDGYSNRTADRGSFSGRVQIETSADGHNFTPIETDARVITQGDGRANVVYVNKNKLSGVRAFRITSVGDTSVTSVKGYTEEDKTIVKLSLRAAKIGEDGAEGEREKAVSFNIGSGDEIQLYPSLNVDDEGVKITYSSSNRYIASVSASGRIQGRVNGSCVITVQASGGKLAAPIAATVEISVSAGLGDVILDDGFDGYHTIAYEDDENKTDDTKLNNFGYTQISSGYTQQFLETDNFQFFTFDPNHEIVKVTKDLTIGKVLDTNNYSSGSVTYELDDEVGGWEVRMISYGGGDPLDRLRVYVSPDNVNWTINSGYVSLNTAVWSGWWEVTANNKQAVPEGTRYVKFEIHYNDSNRWNPQIEAVKVYGCSDTGADESFLDKQRPKISVNGSYPTTAVLNGELELLDADYSDNFATKDELLYTRRVYLVMNGAEIEQAVTGNKITFSALGTYIIRYQVEDLAGNRAEVEYHIEVTDEVPAKGCGGCKGDISPIALAMLGIIALFKKSTIL